MGLRLLFNTCGPQPRNRCSITLGIRLEQIKIRSRNFLIDFQKYLFRKYYLIWFKCIYSSIYGMEIRHIQQREDAFQQSWKNKKGDDFPPLYLLLRVTSKVQVEMETIMLVTPTRAAIVSKGTTKNYSGPNFTSKNRRRIAETRLPKPPSVGKQNFKINSMGSFRKKTYCRRTFEKGCLTYLRFQQKWLN